MPWFYCASKCGLETRLHGVRTAWHCCCCCVMQFTPLYVGVPPYFNTSPPLGGGYVDPVSYKHPGTGSCNLLITLLATVSGCIQPPELSLQGLSACWPPLESLPVLVVTLPLEPYCAELSPQFHCHAPCTVHFCTQGIPASTCCSRGCQ